jgi:phosphoribosylformylglycinamidine synthase subunit PurS
MKVQVTIGFRPGVLDPEAAAIERSLKGLGFDGIKKVRKSKLVELELATKDRAEAEAQVKAMCDKLLANPGIESYAIALEG